MGRKKISAVYQIKNVITGEIYIGSSVDVKSRWAHHKCPGRWNDNPNIKLYQAFKKYGLDKFEFIILSTVISEDLRKVEQQFIDMLQPAYNDRRSKGLDVERMIKYNKRRSKSEKRKELHKKYMNKYNNKRCLYNGEELTLAALISRLRRHGISNPIQEARKYLIQ